MEHTALNAIRNTMTKTATALLMTKILFCIPTPLYILFHAKIFKLLKLFAVS